MRILKSKALMVNDFYVIDGLCFDHVESSEYIPFNYLLG